MANSMTRRPMPGAEHPTGDSAKARALDSLGVLPGALDAAWQRSKYRNPGELVFTSHAVPRHFGPDACTAWDDAQVNNARLFLQGRRGLSRFTISAER